MYCLTLCAMLLAEPFDRIDAAVEASLKRNDCPGAVVLVVHKDEVVFRKAYGLRTQRTPMTHDTVFDMASLTKPIATATSIMILAENGKLKFTDKVSQHWPEFGANGKADVTIEQCLVHTTGLTADNAIKDYEGTRAEMLGRIAALKLEAVPGTRFRYSDVGFIVLGELAERLGKMPLDQFAKKHVFDPLKMADTGYRPSDELKKRVAPTSKRNDKLIVGEVHDPRSFALGGVAGHAGLFSTADDVARYCRMLLRNGELDGTRILKPETVKLFTEPQPVPGGAKGKQLLRSRGWDVDTSYSAPRGDVFRGGFGHTGFTGTSAWIDPDSRTAVIILTSRLHPDEKGNVTQLRREVATIVANAIGLRREPVSTGIDVLRKEQFAALKGRKIGLVTNHTGLAADGTPTIDLLAAAEGVKLVALFSPEHGIRGEVDEKVGDTTDAKTGLPVYSLYGKRTKPDAETLKGIDTLVYDIQDIGCRFYTYSSTLGHILETAKEHNLKVVVLDRPNPIDGVTIEGPVRDPDRSSFVAYHDLPLRHGLTVGEMAKLFNAERRFNADLTVIAMTGWRRSDTFDRTGLTWRNPSPNMRHLTAALLYPGVGLLETTNISVGRGTERPFEWIGAPYLDGRQLAAELNARNLPGVRFVPVTRTPTYSTHKDKPCHGVDIIVDDWSALRPVPLGLHLATALRKVSPNDWNPKNYDRLLVHKATFDGLLAGNSIADLEQTWQPELQKYLTRRAAFLLY